jgi:deazaflavin-dependent oxidoreductase (nitroreductase family)
MKISPDGRLGRLAQRISLHPTFRRFGPAVVPHVDRVLHRLTGGRLALGGVVLPVIMLEHTGARTGRPRSTPLAALPDGAGYWLVGSNFGLDTHPAWTANLLAHPDVEVVHRRRRSPVRARLVEGDERAEAWTRLTALWPAYADYAEGTDRPLRVFRLDPR